MNSTQLKSPEVTKHATRRRKIARDKIVFEETKTEIPKVIDQSQKAQELRAVAVETLLYALRTKRNGRLALEVLKGGGMLKNLVKGEAPLAEDHRTPEERLRDEKVKALIGLMSAVVDRGEAYGSPVDVNNIGDYVMELHPMDE